MKAKNPLEPLLKITVENTLAQRLVDAADQVMCSLDANDQFIYTNTAGLNHFGYTTKALCNKHFTDIIVEADRAHTFTALQALKLTAQPALLTNNVVCCNGCILNVTWQMQWDQQQNITLLWGRIAIPDKEFDAKEKEIQKKLFRAYKLSQIGWWELDFANNRLEVSDEIFAMYGVERCETDSIAIDKFLEMVHPDDVQELKDYFNDINKIFPACYEHRLIKPCGEVIYLIHYIETIRNRQGEVLQIHGTTKNITQRKLAQMALAASEEKANKYAQQLEETLDNFGNSFITLNKNLVITFWNRQTEVATSISKAQAIGKSFWDVFPKALTLKFHHYFLHALNHQVPVHFEEYAPTYDIWLEVKAFPTASGLSLYIKNLNEKKKQEEEIKLSNERFLLVAEATADTLWDWDLQTNTCYMNESFTHIYGYNFTAENARDVWQAHLHSANKKKIVASLVKAINDSTISTWQQDYQFIRKDGSIAFVNDRATILRNEQGTALRMVGAMRDQTDKIRLEKIVAEDKIEMQKQISKTIIKTQERERSILGKELHDNVNQLLTTAKLYVENVAYYPDQKEQFIEKATTLIQKGINEIRYLSKALITPTLFDIGFEASIQELIDYYKQLQAFDIELGFVLAEEMVEKELRLSIYRILQELLNNAVKYSKASRVSINFNKDERYITLLYKDNGIGFDPSAKKNGLGLSNIKNRVELFKGKMRTSTAIGKGLSIMIVFPY